MPTTTELAARSAHGDLPLVDLNLLVPDQETVVVKFDDKPENVDLCSIRLADKIIDEMLEGRVAPLEFAVKRRLLINALDVAYKDKRVKDLMLTEVAKYGRGEQATALGATITVTKRTTYKYDQDEVWARLNRETVQPAKDELKRQEELIKTACKNGHDLVNPETGELRASIVPAPTTESITVSLAKKKS